MSQFALRWILMFDAVSRAIPGGKRREQVAENCGASDLPPLTLEAIAEIDRVLQTEDRAVGPSALVSTTIVLRLPYKFAL